MWSGRMWNLLWRKTETPTLPVLLITIYVNGLIVPIGDAKTEEASPIQNKIAIIRGEAVMALQKAFNIIGNFLNRESHSKRNDLLARGTTTAALGISSAKWQAVKREKRA